MSKRSMPCRYYNKPGGCRKNPCPFEHIDPPGSSPASPQQRDAQGSSSPPVSSGGDVPKGVCSYYWRTGECARGFGCRYNHVRGPGGGAVETASGRSTTGTIIPAMLAPMLNSAALARLSDPGTDALFTPNPKARSPTEVHNLLKRFLFDNYRFRHTFDIYAFVSLLGDATTHNSTWAADDGQLLLSAIAKDNGLLRINDILIWDTVSIRSGNNKTVLSFQRAYVPLLQYLSSDFVVKSILSHLINALYMLLMEHFDSFSEKVETCMEEGVTVLKTFNEPGFASGRAVGGSQIFGALAVVLLQCLTRVKNATSKYPRLRALVHNLKRWLNSWITGVSANPPTFVDALSSSSTQAREQICKHLMNKVDQLVAIVDREHGKAQRTKKQVKVQAGSSEEGTLAALHNSYVGPGELRPEGPRHDNDHVEIADIRIAPTHEELTSRLLPFLPANLYGAPHPLPEESPERLLDIQFRLLREELTASLRTSVQQILDDLQSTQSRTQLTELMQRGGGKYRGHSDSQDTVLFNVYTNVEFLQISPDRRGISVGMSLDTPPGRPRVADAKRRALFWEGMSGKRLMSGGLVALIWKKGSDIGVHLGLISSSLRDHVASTRESSTRIAIRVAFFDPAVQLRILHELRLPVHEREGMKLLIEATVMFASVRPFLEALSRVEPTSVPFMKYLVHRPPNFLSTFPIEVPAYAKLPDFELQLSSLFAPSAGVEDLKLSVTDPESVQAARELLRTRSRLDPSQADAVIDTLTREVALIQGPPGTGKSFTGVELLRILVENKAGPILMIAFTNHALDHLLCSVLDAGITQKIVRLGSRSADERISQFSIEAMEEVAGRSRLQRAFAHHHRELKQVEGEIRELMKECLHTTVDSASILRHLEVVYPVQHQDFVGMPPWIDVLYKLFKASEGGGEWTRVGQGGRDEEIDNSPYAYWLSASDLQFLELAHIQPVPTAPQQPDKDTPEPPAASANQFDVLNVDEGDEPSDSESLANAVDSIQNEDFDEELLPEEVWMLLSDESEPQVVEDQNFLSARDNRDPSVNASSATTNIVPVTIPTSAPTPGMIQPSDFYDVRDFFHHFDYIQTPPVPRTDRSIAILMEVDDVWNMSRSERQRLHAYWENEVRTTTQENRVQEFERLRQKHAEALERYNEGKDEARCQLLKNVDIIGCTTTGAASLTAFLKAIAPKIMLVEEAGQVLEPHVLGSLVPSIQHLILIGDPLQLRPTLNNYALSMDHKHGSLVYKFDMSLMERLSTSGFPMSQINVQRRMRPTISELVRSTLYPQLEDHESVKHYSNVHGIAKNVFFLTHNHKENGGEDESISKFNSYEVDMIVDLVMYLLRQGPYGGEGDIVVLCAYLGQLARVRDALADKVAVVIDERDQRELADREAEDDTALGSTSVVEHVKVSKRVRLRTIDNYQGEEAKIVILSLVRNSGGSEEDEVVHGHSAMGRISVGFLKSENRTNVALSRAREGLFILGNTKDLAARSKMWRSVISLLEKDDSIGDGFPIICHRHPDEVQYVSRPGQLPRIAPDGGCLLQCDARLGCGHLCPFKCHSDDPNHVAVTCAQHCTRLCARGHPCSKSCAEQCGQCFTLVPDVELPCGHVKSHVPCAFLDDLAEVTCDVTVRKKLPHCEHEADMKCSENPAQYRCLAACGGIMECCGRDCQSQCFQCQVVNATEGEPEGSIVRKIHCSHPCQRPLYCEHLCGKPCSTEHECATRCQAPCRQVCAHARCRKPCSTPCAPCQEPCTWKCPHRSCPVPCGSICARLPCDMRCETLLRCGHRCPSVCGEDCSIQVCPLCTPDEDKEVIVDLVLQRSLADVDPDMETVDEMLITIPACRHVFTVETLDGHLSMPDYYVQDPSGVWVGLRTPPIGFLKPPTCPSCRAAITCPRYGRVFKRADLDILENNVASHMAKSLADIASRLADMSIEDMKTKLQSDATNSNLSITKPPAEDKEKRRRKQTSVLREARSTPIAVATLDPGEDLHGIPIPEAKTWRSTVRNLLTAYREICAVVAARPSHTHAWEASFTYLYQQEMDAAMQDPARAPRNPHEYAMRIAKLRIGQPQPRADMRFLVEAFWASINVRLTMVELAKTFVATLTTRTGYPEETKHVWELYVFFVLRSCTRDAEIALTTAQESESHRQAVKTQLLCMRVELESFTFNVETLRGKSRFGEHRQEIADRALAKCLSARRQAASVIETHRKVASRSAETQLELDWLNSNFTLPSQTIIREWDKIEEWVRKDVFYEPVSLKEIEDIVKGLDFSHTGHFYKCPNGHTFVIADCGGAVERASCPECGAAIGGSGHQLLGTNTRAMEYEEVARAQGAQRSPWAWGV